MTSVMGACATNSYRIGIGHDTHRLGPGTGLRLGGVTIPYDRSLVGHSDADALLHAVTDALLGATAWGDIGEWFPDVDPANRNRDSAEMLQQVAKRMAEEGLQIANLDCIVFAQSPKLSAFKVVIRSRIADILDIEPDQVGLKAKTGEAIGPVGRQEAIMAQCVALVQSVPGLEVPERP